MQWTREVQAGFTKGKPWLPVEKDYRHWCVEAEAESEEICRKHVDAIVDVIRAKGHAV